MRNKVVNYASTINGEQHRKRIRERVGKSI